MKISPLAASTIDPRPSCCPRQRWALQDSRIRYALARTYLVDQIEQPIIIFMRALRSQALKCAVRPSEEIRVARIAGVLPHYPRLNAA